MCVCAHECVCVRPRASVCACVVSIGMNRDHKTAASAVDPVRQGLSVAQNSLNKLDSLAREY